MYNVHVMYNLHINHLHIIYNLHIILELSSQTFIPDKEEESKKLETTVLFNR